VHERHAGPVRQVRAGGRVEHDEVGAGADAEVSDVARRRARAPPAVAAQTASATVMPISRTAKAIMSGIELVKLEPGLQSLASATVTPASSSGAHRDRDVASRTRRRAAASRRRRSRRAATSASLR
jgi:hypothetical protein